MHRTTSSVASQLIAAAALALSATAALADDSSMSLWTGDSYAYFNGFDYTPARFNMARASQPTQSDDAVRIAPKARDNQEKQRLLAERLREHSKGPFRDDTA